MGKKRVDLLVKNVSLVTVDKTNRVFLKGAVAVDGSRIAAVGESSEVVSSFGAEQVIEGAGRILCPGFIDTHVHLAQAILRGAVEGVGPIPWLRDFVWPLQGSFQEGDGEASAALCASEMIRSGTTCFLEVLLHGRYGLGRIAELVERSGLRGMLGRAVMDRPAFSGESVLHEGMLEDKEDSIRDALRILGRLRRRRSRVGVWFGPRPIGNCNPETYREIAELARRHKTGVTIHHSEVREQVRYCKREYKMLPTEFMRSVGLVGDNVVYAHCVRMEDKELEIMAESRTSCSHVPSSDMKLAMGVAPIAKMVRLGVNVSLGCNGGANNNTYDMIREASRACLLQRVTTHDPGAVTNVEALRMATINGAKALGLQEEIGSIEVGKKADFVILNCSRPHVQPLLDPVATLVHGAGGGDVETVVVDGRFLMRNHEVLTLAEDRVITEAQKRVGRIIEKSGVKLPYSTRT